jgi:tRNA 2-thiouridine synthesizing protein E
MNAQMLETTDDGFLLESDQWDETVARQLAERIPLTLTEAHWEIISFIRGYHARFRHLPNNRMFVKAVAKALGPEKGNSRYLNALFAGSPVKYTCMVAGLPKPPGCI